MSRKCPLTYERIADGHYSKEGLHRFGRKLLNLIDLPYSAEQLRNEALLRAAKLSIQGVQPKLSAKLNLKEQRFELADIGGTFILKPPSLFPEVPENEDLTMHLAALAGFSVPVHGLIYAQDHSLVYVIKRFDRLARGKKLAVEDFAQLAGKTRATKYNFSMERLIPILDTYCTFPALEKLELWKRTIFNFLTGNEDMHLKNYSLITEMNLVKLAPVYDFLNSSIVLRDPEELALSLKGKKRGLTATMLIKYFGSERLQLESKVIEQTLENFSRQLNPWKTLIEKSFLSDQKKEQYCDLLQNRSRRLNLI